ncbi:MAG: TIGR00159 family protein [Verrucomicrobiales bacterium]|nr:TIGR00159 family protein [Verrucomicrobiales bacterium]
MVVVEWLMENWRALVEIGILSILIYHLVMFIRGTRGAPVVVGFVLLTLALTMITIALELRVLRMLLENFFAFIAVAVIVLFQPELRRILGELGRLPLFVNAREQRENIEVIVEAAERASDVRMGMLIAIERTISLREIVDAGIEVDCEATPEMLETIFFPNNAIHDGGVLINGDRITHAACIFPLTQKQDLQKSLGTRHRAAIGLSEESDAVVVVVSEETGMISYTDRGRLVRGVSAEELRAHLSSALLGTRQSRRNRAWLRWRGRQQHPAKPTALPKKPSEPTPDT